MVRALEVDIRNKNEDALNVYMNFVSNGADSKQVESTTSTHAGTFLGAQTVLSHLAPVVRVLEGSGKGIPKLVELCCSEIRHCLSTAPAP